MVYAVEHPLQRLAVVRPLVAAARAARRVELAHQREAGDRVHRHRELALEAGFGTEVACDLPRDLGGAGVDPALDGDQPLAQLLVVGGRHPELCGDGEQRAREVLPEHVEECPQAGRPVARQLAGALRVAGAPLLGQVLEGARDEIDAVREVVDCAPCDTPARSVTARIVVPA